MTLASDRLEHHYLAALEAGLPDEFTIRQFARLSGIAEARVADLTGSDSMRGMAEAVLAGARVQRSKRWIANQIEVRLLRQERLLGEEPIELHAIMLESALAQASKAQLLHLDSRCRLANVTVQVLPHRAGFHEGQYGAFTVLDFPTKADRSVLYVEHAAGSLHVEDPSKVKVAKLTFTHLSKLALTPAESAEWIGRLAAER